MTPPKNYTVEEIKALRVETDALIQKVTEEQERGHEGEHIEHYELYSMASYQTLVHLTNAKMWLGKMLEGKGNPFPKELEDKAENVQ